MSPVGNRFVTWRKDLIWLVATDNMANDRRCLMKKHVCIAQQLFSSQDHSIEGVSYLDMLVSYFRRFVKLSGLDVEIGSGLNVQIAFRQVARG